MVTILLDNHVVASVRLSVIIPFHRDLGQLTSSLSAVRASLPDAEVIVCADGADEDCRPLAARLGAQVLEVPGPMGPAIARNRGAAVATGEALAFVDVDVVVDPGAIAGLCRVLADEPTVAAAFGAYNELPACRSFMSQYKNLSHSYVHETGNPEASTFWAGLGVVRADAFRAVGGFDERFRQPSVEDIELGYRLRRAGFRVRLDPRFRGQHLKRWTLWGAMKTDVIARGVPWTQVVRKFRALTNDLNLRRELRLSVVLAYIFALSVVGAFWTGWALVLGVGALAAIGVLNASYYRWFARVRGVPFAVAVFPAHLLHHLCNGVSFVVGTSLSLAAHAGLHLPGSVPLSIWSRSDAALTVRSGAAPPDR